MLKSSGNKDSKNRDDFLQDEALSAGRDIRVKLWSESLTLNYCAKSVEYYLEIEKQGDVLEVEKVI